MKIQAEYTVTLTGEERFTVPDVKRFGMLGTTEIQVWELRFERDGGVNPRIKASAGTARSGDGWGGYFAGAWLQWHDLPGWLRLDLVSQVDVTEWRV